LGRRPSRSAAVVAALELYYARRVEDRVREETIAYYAGLSADERNEDVAIARASARGLTRVVARQEAGGARRKARRRQRT